MEETIELPSNDNIIPALDVGWHDEIIDLLSNRNEIVTTFDVGWRLIEKVSTCT